VVEHSTHYPKVGGLSPPAAGTRRKMAKNVVLTSAFSGPYAIHNNGTSAFCFVLKKAYRVCL
jgi:hypothetical protein